MDEVHESKDLLRPSFFLFIFVLRPRFLGWLFISDVYLLIVSALRVNGMGPIYS